MCHRALHPRPYLYIRELENIIEHAVALCDGETVHEQDLPEYVLQPSLRGGKEAQAATVIGAGLPRATALADIDNLDDNLAAYERAILLRALSEARGVKKRAAELLGINYRSFRHRLQKYGLGGLGSTEQADSPTDA